MATERKNLSKIAASDAKVLTGHLQIEVIKKSTGKVFRRIAIQNTITYKGLVAPLYLLAQDAVTLTDFQIVKLWAGEGTVPPTKSDTALNAPLSTSPSTGGVVTLTGANRTVSEATSELVITATLGTAHANGHTLSEVGLFMANTQMFARQVHPGIPKTNAFSINYTWRIATTANN